MLKEPNLAKEAGQGLLSIVSSYARGDLGGIASTAMGLFKKATSGDDVYQRNLRTKTSPADVIMWSGSKDDQTSYVECTFPDEPDFFHARHDSVATIDFSFWEDDDITPTTLEECFASSHLNEAFVPHRDMRGNILI